MARSESSRMASNDYSHSALTSLQVSVDSLMPTAADSQGHHIRRTVTQCIVIGSLASFVVGVVMTAASFGPLFYSAGQPPVIIVIFQVLGPLLLGFAGTVWVACALLFYKWKKRIKRRECAARLRSRVQLHAYAIDVLKRPPQPGDLLAPSDHRQVLEQLRLVHKRGKKVESIVAKSNSTTIIGDTKRSFDARSVKKSLSNITYLVDEQKESGDIKEEKENTPSLGNSSRRPDAMPLPGIFVTHYDQSDVDVECDRESLCRYEPRKRCETYSAGGTRCTLTVSRDDGGSSCGSSGASQRSLPWSSKCSSRLGVGDSGWEGDVSRDGSLSNVSRRDWSGGPCSDAVGSSVMASTSMNVFLPFSFYRRHSASIAEQKFGKTSTSKFEGRRDPAVQQDKSGGAAHCLSVKSEVTDRSSGEDDEVQHQSLSVRGQVPDVHLSISSSRSPTETESATVKVSVDDEDSDNITEHWRRSMTIPTKRRRPLRQREAVKSRGAELTTIWINHQQHQHTDDSEVERRVERLLYEIDHSVTDSVDESKIQSQEFEILSD